MKRISDKQFCGFVWNLMPGLILIGAVSFIVGGILKVQIVLLIGIMLLLAAYILGAFAMYLERQHNEDHYQKTGDL